MTCGGTSPINSMCLPYICCNLYSILIMFASFPMVINCWQTTASSPWTWLLISSLAASVWFHCWRTHLTPSWLASDSRRHLTIFTVDELLNTDSTCFLFSDVNIMLLILTVDKHQILNDGKHQAYLPGFRTSLLSPDVQTTPSIIKVGRHQASRT